jgi:hypothetical protein
VVLRVVDAVGLGTDSGDAGVVLIGIILAAVVFAVGTLVYTVSAVIAAPQVVMFIGLTHTTIGLDRVAHGGSHAIDGPAVASNRFRWLTRPMLLGFVVGVIGAVVIVTGA